MSLTELPGHGYEGRAIRLRVKRDRDRVAQIEAYNEIRMFNMGEPSAAFYPHIELSVPAEDSQVIFQAAEIKAKGRKGDLAKRRGEIIHTILEEPQNYPVTEQNLGFIERQKRRIHRFAITLGNKGKLHPQIAEILGL